MGKNNKADTDAKKDSNKNHKQQNDHIDRQGKNG